MPSQKSKFKNLQENCTMNIEGINRPEGLKEEGNSQISFEFTK